MFNRRNKTLVFIADKEDLLSPAILVAEDALSSVSLPTNFQATLTVKQFLKQKNCHVVDSSSLELINMGEVGDGLRAAKYIRKGSIVAVHGGIITRSQERIHNPYKQLLTNELCINGKKNLSAADYIQHAFPPAVETNEYFHRLGGLMADLTTANVVIKSIDTVFNFPLLVYVAQEDIQPGQLITSDFGLNYLLHFFMYNEKKISIWDTEGKESSLLMFRILRSQLSYLILHLTQYSQKKTLASLAKAAGILSISHQSIFHLMPAELKKQLRSALKENIKNKKFFTLLKAEKEKKFKEATQQLAEWGNTYLQAYLSMDTTTFYKEYLTKLTLEYVKKYERPFNLSCLLNLDEDFIFNHPSNALVFCLSDANFPDNSNSAKYYLVPSGNLLNKNSLYHRYKQLTETSSDYVKQKKYDIALEHCLCALAIAKDHHLVNLHGDVFMQGSHFIFASKDITQLHLMLSSIYFAKKKYAEALYFLNIIQYTIEHFGCEYLPKALTESDLTAHFNECYKPLGIPLLPKLTCLDNDMMKKYKLLNNTENELAKGLRHSAASNHPTDLAIFLELFKINQMNINQQDHNKTELKTALHWAIIKDSIECVQQLLAAGAHTDIKDASSKTALDYVKASKNPDLKKLFALLLSKESSESDEDTLIMSDGNMSESDEDTLIMSDENNFSGNDETEEEDVEEDDDYFNISDAILEMCLRKIGK